MMRYLSAVFAVALVLAPGSLAFANTASGGPSEQGPRPPVIPVSAFSDRANMKDARLSPEGDMLAFVVRTSRSSKLLVADTENFSAIASLDLTSGATLNWIRWAGNKRIILSFTQAPKGGRSVGRFTRLMVYDLETGRSEATWTPMRAKDGDDVIFIDPLGSYLLLSASDSSYGAPDVWQVPLDEGEQNIGTKLVSAQSGISSWYADDAGVVRIGVARQARGVEYHVYYRGAPTSKFRRVESISARDRDGIDKWDVLGLVAGSDEGFAIVEDTEGKATLHRMNFSTGVLGAKVFSGSWQDLHSVYIRNGELVGVEYLTDELTAHWFDKELGQLQLQLTRALASGSVRILDESKDQSKFLVMQGSSSDPGALYFFDATKKSLNLVGELRPRLSTEHMAQTTAVTITARDGAELRSYLTLPKGRTPSNLPLVIMPHGGPYGVRDYSEYNDWVQLLANRGYAVLQPNFRGSGGFGEAFERLGDGEIGRGMQDDLDDARQWAVDGGYADPQRICLVGASYGGYAALWGVVRNPELYRCAASFAGVTDWEAILAYDRDYLGRGYMNKEWYRRIWRPRIEGQDSDLRELSLTETIGRLDRPILVAHGTDDLRVPFSQFEKLVAAAEKRGKDIETLVLEDDHNLRDEVNEHRLLERLVSFLKEHNPAD